MYSPLPVGFVNFPASIMMCVETWTIWPPIVHHSTALMTSQSHDKQEMASALEDLVGQMLCKGQYPNPPSIQNPAIPEMSSEL